MMIICYKQRIILENAVGREKDVQSIDLDSVMKKKRAASRRINRLPKAPTFGVQTFMVLLRFPRITMEW
jgi:hypothetical protein